MTFSSKVWGDTLCRLQEDIPDFAFDAWIAPLIVKRAANRVILGCPSSFHRDRVRIQYGDALARCLAATLELNVGVGVGTALSGEEDGAEQAAQKGPDSATRNDLRIEIVTIAEFESISGRVIPVKLPQPLPQREEIAASEGVGATSKPTAPAQLRCLPAPGPTPNALPGEARAAGSVSDSDSHPLSRPDGITPAHSTPQSAALSMVSPGDANAPVPSKARRIQRVHERTGAPGGPLHPHADAPIQGELPFSFENFVVGPCNALAREAVLALARSRQQSLNQVYLGAASGMGKTHLARAAAVEARQGSTQLHREAQAFARPDRPRRGPGVVVTSAEQFTTDFVAAMRGGESDRFKRRYRGSIGLLVVEDVQFFSGRAKTQLELFNTVQHVLDAGGRVLLTGDRAPQDLGGLHERLRSQVARGFVAEIEPPDALVRRHIIRSKAAAGGFRLPDDCLDLLVESTQGSVRDIESVLIQVVTTASLMGRTIDLDLTREAVSLKTEGASSRLPRRIEVSEVVRIVSAFFGKRPETLASRSRRRDVLVPRQLAMYLAHRYTDASLAEIGRGLGRDHPSVRNAIERIERQVLENAPVRYQVEALSERVERVLASSETDAAR